MKIRKIITTYDGAHATMTDETEKMLTDDGTGFDLVNLYPQMKYQRISGFGGAITESAGYVFSKMDDKTKEAFLQSYYGKDGSGYRIARISIDSCDFSLGHYTAMNDQNDTEFKSFSLENDQRYVIPLLRAAQKTADAPIELMLSPWSPPAFMKTNGQRNGGGSLKPEYMGFWAKYVCRYIQEYKKLGFSVKYLTIQNEPGAAQRWDSCLYSAREEKAFLQNYLYPALQKAGLSDIMVCIWDHNKESVFDRAVEIIDNDTDKMVQGIAFHWYSGDHFEALSLLRDKYPDKELVFSEGCVEYGCFKSDAHLAHAQKYAHDIIGNLNAGMNAFLDWNVLLDENGGPNHVGNFCDAPVLFDEGNGKMTKNLSYFYISHFSRFIKRGAKRIGFSRYTDKVEVTAFENADGSIVAVFLNCGEEPIKIVLRVTGELCKFELPVLSICTTVLFR
jgi:glucosylceramidase